MQLSDYEHLYKNPSYSDGKIVLRKLSDMAEKEIYKIVSIMLNKEVDFLIISRTDDDFIVAEYKNEESADPRYDRVQMEIHISNISSHFRIDNCWNYINSKGTGQTSEPLFNSHEITRYLLSKHFDLFGLIESDLAIDATTLKTQPLKQSTLTNKQ